MFSLTLIMSQAMIPMVQGLRGDPSAILSVPTL